MRGSPCPPCISQAGWKFTHCAMRRVFLGVLSLVVLLPLPGPNALGVQSRGSGRTIKDLSDAVPLGVLERSVGPKFYQSLLVSPLEDWNTVRARLARTRLRGTRIIRPSANPAYNSLALQWANELTLVGDSRAADTALMHLFIYKIADGFMAVSLAYPEATAGQQTTKPGTVRLSIKKTTGPWTELTPSEQENKRSSVHERGRRLRRMDRMPMDAITIPGR